MTSKIFKSPLVSVLMPAYNREKYIGEAIESVLVQTYTHWELIIVDDGSRDSTAEIVKSYQAKDSRIILYQFPENKGIPYARNQCLELAKGEYLANLDSDDIALPDRLEKQVQFMEENPEVGICGGKYVFIDEQNKKVNEPFLMPTEDKEIKANFFLYKAHVFNTTLLIRKRVIGNVKYNIKFTYAQDLKFYSDVLHNVTFANLDKVLVLYRQHKGKVSVLAQKEQFSFAKQAIQSLLEKLNFSMSKTEIATHLKFVFNEPQQDLASLKDLIVWLEKLVFYHNPKEKIFDQALLRQKVAEMWLKVCLANTSKGFKVWLIYQKSRLKDFKIGKKNQLTFLMDCILKRKSTYLP